MSPSEHEVRPSVERRKSVRHACMLEVAWVEAGRTVFWPGWRGRVLNVSRAGVGLHVPDRSPDGAALVADLYGAGNASYRGQFAFRVARADRQPDDTWSLGATFEELLSEEQVQTLLG